MSYYLSRPIVIAAYEARWPQLYEQERRRLQEVLGAFARRLRTRWTLICPRCRLWATRVFLTFLSDTSTFGYCQTRSRR
jgi:hypothetical protein